MAFWQLLSRERDPLAQRKYFLVPLTMLVRYGDGWNCVT